MKKFLAKTISIFIITVFLLPTVMGIFPEKAEAQLATIDALNAGQNVVLIANTGGTAVTSYSLELKAFVLDTLATTLAKNVIRSLTSSVVDWIEGGFEGSPAFMTNPGGFFLDVADQISGEFLAKGGPLANLCNDFSIDIRLALSFKYHRKPRQKYECTLSKVIQNTKNGLGNVTVNGKNVKDFRGGNFNDGGWPAFVTLSTDTQNNPYGAYLEANSELGIRVGNMQRSKDKEIGDGKGFLSWRNPKCKAEVESHNKSVEANFEALEDASGEEYSNLSQATGGESTQRKSINDCKIETPGSFIAGGLENSASGPLRELELVDSINEIVNALAAQLINTALTGGLAALNGSGPSDSTSYLSQIQAEAQSVDTPGARELRAKFLGDINRIIADTNIYRGAKQASFDQVERVKNLYLAAQACYESKNNPMYANQISNIQKMITYNINPVSARFSGELIEAQFKYDKFTGMKSTMEQATSISQMNAAASEFSQIQRTGGLITPEQIAQAHAEVSDTTTSMQPHLSDANQRLAECQSLGTTGSGGVIRSGN